MEATPGVVARLPAGRPRDPARRLDYDTAVRVLYLCDRLSLRGGADQHLLQVVDWAAASGHSVQVAAGRIEAGVPLAKAVVTERVRDLSARTPASSQLPRLERLLDDADLVHCQNVMNPVALRAAVETGRALVTVQDHRVFCPGPGKTLPDGVRCRDAMADHVCARSLPDLAYRERMLGLTLARRDALRGAVLVVLSRFMADELASAGLPGALVVPPWFEAAGAKADPGDGFLLAGRLVAHKAPLDAWHAWRRSAGTLTLRVAGTGPLAGELGGALLLGWLPPEAFALELRRSRALLLPGRWQEPFGMVGVEALAQGTPAIVAATGGVGGWADAGCLRVAAGDIGAMAEAMATLAGDPAAALALGEQGRAMVGQRFARGPIEDRLQSLYAAVAAGHRPPESRPASGFVAGRAAG